MNYATRKIAAFSPGAEPTPAPISDRYKDEYVSAFVAKWDDLIDWDRRAATEGSFFIDMLRAHGARSVLDVATGTGFHSIRLLRAGFDVTSADGCEHMLERAAWNSRRHGTSMRPVHADWRWLGRSIRGEFDALICLGNSFTHLFDEADRRTALAGYFSLLKRGGVLILDQRNYDVLLDHGIGPRHRYYYCARDVSVAPVHVDPGVARFRYEFPDGAAYHLDMFPLRKNYVRQLLAESRFHNLRTYGDFKAAYLENAPDFFIHVAQKPECPTIT